MQDYFVCPVLEDDWNVDSIVKAFHKCLNDRQFPTGIRGMKVEILDYGSALWTAEQQRN